MMKRLYYNLQYGCAFFLVSVFCFGFASCNQYKSAADMEILPLHPYQASNTDYNADISKSHTFIVKFYFIRGATDATDKLSEKVDSFLRKELKKDSINFNDYGSYIVRIFRESSKINQDYRENVDGIFSDMLGSHEDDLLFEYEWERKEFTGRKFYKNGKMIKKTSNEKVKLSFISPGKCPQQISLNEHGFQTYQPFN